MSAVIPSSDLVSTSAPCSSSTRTFAKDDTARINAVPPRLSRAFGSAPFSSSTFMHSAVDTTAAYISGVSPSALRPFTAAPAASDFLIARTSSARIAWKSPSVAAFDLRPGPVSGVCASASTMLSANKMKTVEVFMAYYSRRHDRQPLTCLFHIGEKQGRELQSDSAEGLRPWHLLRSERS